LIFQALDDKSECIGIYADGKLTFADFPEDLTKTWRYSASIADPAVEYAWIRASGRNIADCCPEDLCNELQATQRKMKAYLKSFKIAKVNMADHCVFDLIPHDFLVQFCEIKNKITEYVFETYEKPENYEHLDTVYKLLHKIRYQKLNLNSEDCKHLFYSSMNRQKIQELMKNYTRIDYNMFGTITGRLTTHPESFPMLTLKKDLRRIIKPHNDLMMSLDYNGAEIRTLLDLCGQDQPEYDIHEWNVQNVIKDMEMTREEAKLYFFAWLYNPESNDIDSEYYDREKVLDKYYKDGYIHTPYGRKIKVEQRKALNYLIQSTTADRVLEKAVLVDQMLEGKKSFISHIVHDEIVIDYADEDRDVVIGVRDIFEDGYVANLRAGKDYYNLNEIKL
jgi:hypothetical protein